MSEPILETRIKEIIEYNSPNLTHALGWLGLTPVIKLVTVLAKSDPADHAETRAYVFLTTGCFYTEEVSPMQLCYLNSFFYI